MSSFLSEARVHVVAVPLLREDKDLVFGDEDMVTKVDGGLLGEEGSNLG